MFWSEIKEEMREKSIRLKTLAKENPIKALALGGVTLVGVLYVVCQICKGEEEKIDFSSLKDVSEVMTETVESEIQSERTYTWKEFGHMVREHERHYENGTIAYIPSYMKITGGKNQ